MSTTKKVLIVVGVVAILGTIGYGMHAGWFKAKPKSGSPK